VVGLTLQPVDRPGAAIVGLALVGLLPLAVGVVLFALGLRRLPQAAPRLPSPAGWGPPAMPTPRTSR
jgi:hypothetical protein